MIFISSNIDMFINDKCVVQHNRLI